MHATVGLVISLCVHANAVSVNSCVISVEGNTGGKGGVSCVRLTSLSCSPGSESVLMDTLAERCQTMTSRWTDLHTQDLPCH